jgi:hypothetical protein
MRWFAAILVFLGPALAQAPVPEIQPGEATFEGKGAKGPFPREVTIRLGDETWQLRALGSGVRKKFVFKVYEGILYGDASVSLGQDPFGEIIRGDWAKGIVMHFVRDVGADKIRGAYRDGFRKVLGEEKADSLLQASPFLSYFDRKIKDGEEMALWWLPGHGLYTRVGNDWKPALPDSMLARALFAIWLGEDPVSKDLRRDMVRFVTAE